MEYGRIFLSLDIVIGHNCIGNINFQKEVSVAK